MRTYNLTKLLVRTIFIVAALLYGFSLPIYAQDSPTEKSVQLVLETQNPVNVTAVSNQAGGSFLVWQDELSAKQFIVKALFVTSEGIPAFRSDGKTVASTNASMENPQIISSGNNAAVVIWENVFNSDPGILYAQRILSNGSLSWGEQGLKISEGTRDIKAYSADSDEKGNVFISFSEASETYQGVNYIRVQRLDPARSFAFSRYGMVIDSSNASKSFSVTVSDRKGGAYFIWTRTIAGQTSLVAQHLTSKGKLSWKNPIEIFSTKETIAHFSAIRSSSGQIYVYWQTAGKQRRLFHNLIDVRGKILWKNNSIETVENLSGTNTNPTAISQRDTSFVLVWSNENNKQRLLYAQKFSAAGKALWGNTPPALNLPTSSQMPYAIETDGSGGILVTWLTATNSAKNPDIYYQRIDRTGTIYFPEGGKGLVVGESPGKSYLSLTPDNGGGGHLFFRMQHLANFSIFYKKISGLLKGLTPLSPLVLLPQDNGILVQWSADSDNRQVKYVVERFDESVGSDSAWSEVTTLESGEKTYSFIDYPPNEGVVYYRVLQIDSSQTILQSQLAKINYHISGKESFYLAQNTPNPFSDFTVIEYNVPYRRPVTIEVYNLKFEEVSKITFDPERTGKGEFEFDGRALAPGVYFYRFSCGEFVEVKKMVVIRD